MSACAHLDRGMSSNQVLDVATGRLPCEQAVISNTCLGADWQSFREIFTDSPSDTVSIVPTGIERLDQSEQVLTYYIIKRPAVDLTIDVTVENDKVVNLFVNQSYWDQTSTQQISRKPMLSLIADVKKRHPNQDWSTLSPDIVIEAEHYILNVSLQRNAINYSLKR